MADKEVRVKIVADTSDITKKLSDLEKSLKDMASTLDKTDGSGLDKATKSVQEFKDAVELADREVDELNDSLDKLDNGGDFDKLTRSGKELSDTLSDVGDKASKSAKEITDAFDKTDRAIDEVADSLEKIDNNGFDKLNRNAKELDDTFERVSKSVKEFDDILDKVDNNDFNTLNRNAKDIQETFKNLADRTLPEVNRQLEKTQDTGRENNTIFDRLKTLFSNLSSEATSFGGKFSSSFEKGKATILEVINTFSNMKTAIETNKKNIIDLNTSIEKGEKVIDALRKKYEGISEEIKEVTERMEILNKAMEMDRPKEQLEQMEKQYKQLEQVLERLVKTQKNVEQAMNGATNQVGKQKRELEQLQEELSNTDTGWKKLGKSLEDALKSFDNGDLNGTVENLKDAFSTFLDMIPTKVKIAIAVITALGKALKECAEQGVNQLQRGFDTLGTVFGKIGSVVKSFGQEIKNAFENITGFEVDLSSMIETVVEFESTMAQVGAICGATDEELALLTATAREWGATTRYSGTEVAEAMTYMGMAGWSTQEVMDGLEGVLNLATVGCIDLAQASDFVTDGLTALGMSASQSNDFVDMLSATIVNSNTGVAQMQSAFENVAPIAGTLGISMSDLSVAIGLMSNQGVKAEKAGTALKNLLTNMASPTDKMTECIKKYNLETAQQMILNGDLIGGIQEMKKQLEGLTASEKTAIVTTIAGKEALSGVSALLNSSTSDINNLKFAVDSSTKSSRAYAESLGLIDKEGNIVAGTFDKMISTQKDAYDQWVKFNEIMAECQDTMTYVGGTTTDLGAIIHKLGEDGEVTTENVNDLLDVFDKLADTSEKTTKVLEKYGIEVKRNEDGSIDFGETLKNLGAVWDKLTDAEKKALAEQLGLEGSVEELNELYDDNGQLIEELVDAYEKMEGVSEHLAKTFDATLKGSILNLSSAIEERLLQIFDKIKPIVQGVIDVLTKFFDIWNGMDEEFGKGFAKAIEYLERESREWGKAIENGLSDIIKSIDNFVNSSSFDNLLQVGTNIINGICNGISKAKENGTLDSAINGIITKIVKWVGDNLPTIIEAGKKIIDGIVKGIEENGDEISEIIKEVIQMQTDIDSSINYAKWKVIGENIGTFIVEGIKSIVKPFFAGLEGFGQGLIGGKQNEKQEEIGENFNQNNNLVEDTLKSWGISDKWSERIANFLFPSKETAEQKGKETGQSFADGTSTGVAEKKEDLGNTVDQNFKDTKPKTDKTANEIGQGVADGIGARLEELDAGELKILQDELRILQEVTSTVAQGIAQSFADIRNSAREEMTGMTNIFRNQFTSMTNIVRNQMVNVANIVKNQATNMASSFRTEFTNMANIVRNQMTNVSNIVRNQMVNCSNIIRNQAVNMANIIRNQFVNMSNIVSNQMTNMANSVRTQFVNISNIVSNQMTNVANTVRTQFTNVSNIVRNQMTNVANTVRSEMTNCSNIVKNQATNMANNFRTQFVNISNIARTQMVNVSNIIRNQAVSWSNIISNQISNARNTFTSQMISMSSVARTQMVNVSNIIRNQAVNWANIVSNQSKNARDNLTRQFMSMHSVVATQMAKCLSTVRSYMSQIASATNKQMTMNFKVNKTITTTNVTKNVTQGLDPINTMSNINNNIRSINPSTMASGLIGGDINFNLNGGASGNLALEVPLYIDGREIARATATYSQEELAKLSKRSNRRRGE